jgi:cytochrome b involved in lipid metabolism
MKKTAFAAFIAFWSVVGTLLAVSTLLPVPQATAQDEAVVITLDELATHDKQDDCWMAIEGKVYDFSAYIPSHPTPPVVMTPWCGKEATEGMRTKGYGRDHSPAAWAMMEPYLVGVLAEE